jgi:hypothetical protein
MATPERSREDEDVLLRYMKLFDDQEAAYAAKKPAEAARLKAERIELCLSKDMHPSKHLVYMAQARAIKARRDLHSSTRSGAAAPPSGNDGSA